MGFTDEYLIISENMRGIDLTAYKEDEEYGLICKILEENMNLQSDSVESDLYVFIHALEHRRIYYVKPSEYISNVQWLCNKSG